MGKSSVSMTFERAVEKAAAYINVKPRTGYQVIRYLKEKGIDEDMIDGVIRQLEEYHYIDDFNFSTMYFRYGFEKGRGVARIRRELAEKGVDREVIQRAYDELEDIPDQFEMAMEIGRPMVAHICTEELSYEDKTKLRAKVGRRLASRGFSSDVIYKVIDRLV